MTVPEFDKVGWHNGIKVKCWGRGKEYFLEVLNVDLINRRILTAKGWYFRNFFELM